MENVINFEEYRKENKGGFAPVTVQEQREEIIKQREEIMAQRKKIEEILNEK
jgi:hypothetical protein